MVMSRMLAERVRFEKTPPMFVLLSLLFLAKCVLGDGSLESTHVNSTSEGTKPPLSANATGESAPLHSTPAAPNINNSHATSQPTITNTTNVPPANNTSVLPPINPTIAHSVNTTSAPPVIITSVVPPVNNVTNKPTVTNATSTTTNPTTAQATNPPKGTDVTKNVPVKSTVIANASHAVNSTKANVSSTSTMITSSPGRVDVTSPVTPTTSERKNPTNVTQENSTTTKTTSTSTTGVSSTSPISHVSSGVSSTTPETTSMPSTDGELTTPSINLSSMQCKNNNECNETQHLTCNVSSGQCTCEEGYSPMGKDFCGKKLGAVCDDKCDAHNTYCGSVGDKNVCMCEDGLTASADGTFCYGIPLMYGDICDHDDNCTLLGSYVGCKQHYCVCEENYVRNYGECKEKIDRLNAPCNIETQVCYKDSERDFEKRICQRGFCQCNSASGYVPDDGICKKKISLLGAPCNAATHVCHQDEAGDNQTLHCHNGICQCKNTFLLDGGQCKRKIDVLGEKCSPDTEICHSDYEGERRHCSNGTCQCKSSFLHENGICKQKISLLGAPCNATSHVCYFQEDGNQQKTHCTDGICQCKAEFALTDKKCQKVRISGAPFIEPSVWIYLIVMIMMTR